MDIPPSGPVWRRAVGRYACDGGIKPGKWIHVLDREVRAERDARAVVDDAPEGVEALDALGALSEGDVSVCEVRVLVRYGFALGVSLSSTRTRRSSANHMSLILHEGTEHVRLGQQSMRYEVRIG